MFVSIVIHNKFIVISKCTELSAYIIWWINVNYIDILLVGVI